MMNSSFVHLVVARALAGPYLTVPPMSKQTALSITNGRFTNFFSHFLFSSASVKLNVFDTTFRNFQSSAISLSRDGDQCPESPGGRYENSPDCDSIQRAQITSCTFENCKCDNDGGAIFIRGNPLSIDRCGFFSCTSRVNGGAIAAMGCEGERWIGDWSQDATLPGIRIDKSCFQQCYVAGTAGDTGAGEENKLGHVLYGYSVQIGIFDFSALDCSQQGSNNAAVFFARSNDLMTEYGNISLSSDVSGGEYEDVSAFQVLYVGRSWDEWKDKSWNKQKPEVTHRFHHTKGFTCKHVYWAHLQQGSSNHIFEYVDVLQTTFVVGRDFKEDTSEPTIFFMKKGQDESTGTVQMKHCNVFDVTGIQGHFYNKDTEVVLDDCKSDVKEWEGIIVITSYVPNAFDMENEQYCPWQPTDPLLETTTEEPFETETSTEEPVEPDVPSSVDIDTFSEPDTDLMTSDAEADPTESDESNEPDESNPEAPPNQNTGLPPAAIAGIVIGILLIIAVILILVFLLLRRKKTSSSGSIRDENEMESETTTITTTTETSYPLTTTANYNETQINQIFELSEDGEADAFREGPEEAI